MTMSKELLAALLVLQAHFAASYLVPLDREAQETLGGLLRWAWPWSGGYSGPLGQVTVSFGFPLSGFFLAVGAAGLFLLAALTVIGIWVPFGWGYSLFPILVTEYAFIRPSRHSVQCHRTALSHHQHGTKLLTDDMKSVQQAARVRLRGGSDGAIGSPLGFYPF
jgi:hypothetical protein